MKRALFFAIAIFFLAASSIVWAEPAPMRSTDPSNRIDAYCSMVQESAGIVRHYQDQGVTRDQYVQAVLNELAISGYSNLAEIDRVIWVIDEVYKGTSDFEIKAACIDMILDDKWYRVK